MGGRRPASPQIVPSQPPAGMIGGGPSIFGRLIRSAGRGKKKFKSGRRRRGGEPQRPPIMDFPDAKTYNPNRTITGRGGRPAPVGYSYGRSDKLIPYPNDPRLKGNTPPIKITPDMCPDPNMHILMADGSQKRAGDLVVGDLVKTYHEKDLEKASKKSLVLALGGTEKYSQLREQLESSYAKATLGEYKVEFVDIIKDVKKIKLTFEGSEIICSLSHKFYVNDSWKEAKNMVIGDEVSNKKLVAIEDVEDGDVVYITIQDAHTYICEGLLSHNKGRRIPRIGDRPSIMPVPPRRPRQPVPPRRPEGGDDIIMVPPVLPPRRRPRRQVGRRMFPRPKPPIDDLGPAPEREIPLPKERLPKITRESDPRGRAPFAPDEKAMAKKIFYERMFEKADSRRQQKSMQQEERGRVNQSRRDETKMRMSEPGEIDINAERRVRRKRPRRMSRDDRAIFRDVFTERLR